MSEASAGSRGPVLVVDDDEGFRALIVAVLDNVGYPTREASTGSSGGATGRLPTGQSRPTSKRPLPNR